MRQASGDQDLRSGVEKALEVWGRFAILSEPSQADVILEVSTSEAKAYATLTSPRGQHLWDDVKGVDTKDDIVGGEVDLDQDVTGGHLL